MFWRPLQYLDFLYAKRTILPGILKSYFQSVVAKKATLKIVHIALSYSCNAFCKHCSVSCLRDESKPVLSTRETASFIKDCLRLGAISFEFTGGEVLLNKNIFELLELCNPQKTIIGVSTNALLVTEQILKRFKKIGVDVVQISLDSSFPDTHNNRRGVDGSYDKVIDSIKLAKKIGLKPIISTIYNPEDPEDMKNIINISKQLGTRLVINPAVKLGKWSENNAIFPSAGYKQTYANLIKNPGVRWSGHINYPFTSCPCGKEGIYITPYGDIMPCVFIPISYGNIKNEPLEKIWKRMYNNLPDSKMRNKGCIVGIDGEFINKYLEPINKKNQLPVFYSKHPGMKAR
jgi:MoaA/NifB/PqqE/SkfB family radical SAM enzyme